MGGCVCGWSVAEAEGWRQRWWGGGGGGGAAADAALTVDDRVDGALRLPHLLVVRTVGQAAERLELSDARLAALELLVRRQHGPHVDQLLDLSEATLEAAGRDNARV